MKKNLLFLLLLFIGCVMIGCNNHPTELALVQLDQGFLGDDAKDLSVSIGIRKGDTELQDLLNNALKSITREQRNQLMVDAVARADHNLTGETIELCEYDNSKPDLVIGLECNYAPFNWTDTVANEYNYPIDGLSGQYADGYDIQIAKYIAKAIGYNLIVKKYTWDALIPALQIDDIDCIIAGMTDTDDRRQSIDFTDNYYVSELVIIVRKGSELENITDIRELKGKRVISQIGTVTDSIIDQIDGVIHVMPVKTFAIAALAVLSGDADAMTAEYPVAQALVAAHSSDNE